MDAALRLLILNLKGVTEKNCYIATDPEPPYKISDSLMVILSLSDGQFHDGLHEGGGKFQCMEQFDIIVTLISRISPDRAGRERETLADAVRGILKLKKRVLDILCTADLTFNVAGQAGVSPFLTQLLAPSGCTRPVRNEGDNTVSLAIRFAADFMWNLNNTNGV